MPPPQEERSAVVKIIEQHRFSLALEQDTEILRSFFLPHRTRQSSILTLGLFFRMLSQR